MIHLNCFTSRCCGAQRFSNSNDLQNNFLKIQKFKYQNVMCLQHLKSLSSCLLYQKAARYINKQSGNNSLLILFATTFQLKLFWWEKNFLDVKIFFADQSYLLLTWKKCGLVTQTNTKLKKNLKNSQNKKLIFSCLKSRVNFRHLTYWRTLKRNNTRQNYPFFELFSFVSFLKLAFVSIKRKFYFIFV